MQDRSPTAPSWHRTVLALAAFLALAGVRPVAAADGETALDRARFYAGVFAGSGLAGGRIVDVDGFANWGHPGSATRYDDSGPLAGALIGRKFELRGVPLRLELDAAFGDLRAKASALDPVDRDETAESEFRWIATLRVGVERSVGRATLFVSGGLAAAEIVNSVTDIDFGANIPRHRDPDDSFRDRSTRIGWSVGVGAETPLSDAWTLRIEASYLDFGRDTHTVNRSGGNRCGRGNPRRPCPYKLENRLGSLRLAVIRRFGD